MTKINKKTNHLLITKKMLNPKNRAKLNEQLARNSYWALEETKVSKERLKLFVHCVHVPLKAYGLKVKMNKSDLERACQSWDALFIPLSLSAERTDYDQLPSKLTMVNMRKQMMKLRKDVLKQSLVAKKLGPLTLELDDSIEKMDEFIKGKGKKRQSDYTYPPAIVSITKVLLKYWHGITGSKKKISGYNYADEHGSGKKIKPSGKNGNPGGAFIQRTLEGYFSIKYNNQQIRTLLLKVAKSKK